MMLGFKEFRNAAITMPVSSYCTASGGDSSDWDVRAFKAKLRLRSGTPFWRLKSPRRKREAFCSSRLFAPKPDAARLLARRF